MQQGWGDNRIYRDGMPKYVVNGSVALYVVVMLATFMVFGRVTMLWYWWLIGFVCVAGFFYGSQHSVRRMRHFSEKKFEKKLYWTAYGVRLFVVIVSYFLFKLLTDDKLDFEPADVEWYDEMARAIADGVYDGKLNVWQNFEQAVGVGYVELADSGYPIYLGIVYTFVGKSVFLARVVQSFWSAFTCLFIYRIARRHFDETTARLAGILCAWMPGMAIYAGLHLKETVMTFLLVWFVERADALMQSRDFSFKTISAMSLIGLSLFLFRTVLGAVAFLAFAMALVFSSRKIIKGGKRALLIILSIGFVAVAFSGRIKEEVMQVVNTDAMAQQRVSMQHRYGSGKGGNMGNKLVDNVGAAVFAPLIFTIPFPTMLQTEGQDQKRYLNGACYVKNVMSGLVLMAMFMMLFKGKLRSLDAEWRKHVLPLATLLGYLLVLVFSQFAHSERFHQPNLPFLMLFAAYGVTHYKPKHRWMWSLWVVAVFVMCMAWSYVKAKGRGMI